MLPDYLVVDPTSPTGLRYSKNRGKRKAGEAAGWLSEYGYWRVTIEGKTYLNHRLVWEFYYGEVPLVRATREEIHDDKFLRHR